MLPLHTTRLILRRFTEADAEVFLAYRNDPDVARYQSWETWSLPEAIAFIEGQKTREPGVHGRWYQIAIALRETHTLIGDCALKIYTPEACQATIGITLARSYQRQGFATEALSCLFDYLFIQKHLHRLVADTDPQNTPAWTLLEHLGMRREGHLRQSLWFKGRWADEYLYAILRDEWLTKRGDA
jgi:aminoglycoside 6'-N-acetyltransferase